MRLAAFAAALAVVAAAVCHWFRWAPKVVARRSVESERNSLFVLSLRGRRNSAFHVSNFDSSLVVEYIPGCLGVLPD